MYKICLLTLAISSSVFPASMLVKNVLQTSLRGLSRQSVFDYERRPLIALHQRTLVSSAEPVVPFVAADTTLHKYIAFAQELRKTMPNNDVAVKRLMRSLSVEELQKTVPKDERAEWEESRRNIALHAMIDPASIHPDDVQKAMKKGDHELLSLLFSFQTVAIRTLQKSQSAELSTGSSIDGPYRLVFSLMRLREKSASTICEWIENRSKQIDAYRRHWIAEKARVLGRVSDDDMVFAVMQADNELIMSLLRCGANPNACESNGNWGYSSLLSRALAKCDAAAVKMLLDAGTAFYGTHDEIETIIRYARGCLPDRIKKVMLLVNSGKDCNLENLIFLAPVHFPEFKLYFENALVMHNKLSSASEKESAQDEIRSFMLKHGIKEEEVTVVRRARSSRVQEAD